MDILENIVGFLILTFLIVGGIFLLPILIIWDKLKKG
jgi:hypothetical protein